MFISALIFPAKRDSDIIYFPQKVGEAVAIAMAQQRRSSSTKSGLTGVYAFI